MHDGGKEGARRPVSRVLYPPRRTMAIHLGRPLPDASRDRPGRRRENPPAGSLVLDGQGPGAPSLLGLAPGGVYPAAPVAGGAVRSYRTLSPLPAGRGRSRRFAFCGTFPGVAPAGRYPAPCFRGARTFLPPRPHGARKAAIRPSGTYKGNPSRAVVKGRVTDTAPATPGAGPRCRRRRGRRRARGGSGAGKPSPSSPGPRSRNRSRRAWP